ncbi:MAG: hypothetical protein WC472_04610 [Candidatus Paceibacterota bacterium]
MAKVTMPLMSGTASGKIGDAIVFFGWKGINVVRGFVIPANPQSGDQGDQRQILGGVGRACGAVKKTSEYEGQLNTLGLIPAGQTKQSYLVKKIIDTYMATPVAFEAIYTEFEAHSAKADFTSDAASIGLADVNIAYKSTAHAFSKGMQLYVLAKVAIALAFTGSPYTTALASWTGTEITALLADLAAA